MSVTRTAVPESDAEPAEPDTDDLTAEERTLDDDEVFHLLQCRRRRDALRYLAAEDGGPVEMRDLAEQVAAWEHDTTVRELASAQRQRVYIPLYQTHLPKLDEAGVVTYDQDRGTVARGPNAARLERYLRVVDGATTGATSGREPAALPAAEEETVAGDDRPTTGDDAPSADDEVAAWWSRHVAGVAVAGLVALGAAGLLAPGGAGWLAVGVVILGVVGLAAHVHGYHGRTGRPPNRAERDDR